MNKVYVFNGAQNNVSIILTGKAGNRVRYNFTNGSVVQRIPPSFMTSNEYEQMLLETSDYFARGMIKLTQTFGEETQKTQSLKKVNSVTNTAEAMEWVAENLQQKATSGMRALEIARKKGYDFPKLKL